MSVAIIATGWSANVLSRSSWQNIRDLPLGRPQLRTGDRHLNSTRPGTTSRESKQAVYTASSRSAALNRSINSPLTAREYTDDRPTVRDVMSPQSRRHARCAEVGALRPPEVSGQVDHSVPTQRKVAQDGQSGRLRGFQLGAQAVSPAAPASRTARAAAAECIFECIAGVTAASASWRRAPAAARSARPRCR